MEHTLSDDADYAEVKQLLALCEADDVVNCYTEKVFSLAKIVLVKEKLTDKTLQLLDEDDYVLRQVTSRRREETGLEEFNDRQLAVIKALEKVLAHCEKEGVKLLGYSDELVAYPAVCNDLEQASSVSLDVETSGVYSGAGSINNL